MWRKSEILKNRKFQILLIFEIIIILLCFFGISRGNKVVVDDSNSKITQFSGIYSNEKGGYYIDGTFDFKGRLFEASGFKLYPGVYKLVLYCHSQDDNLNSFGVITSQKKHKELLSNNVPIFKNENVCVQEFYIINTVDSSDGLKVFVDYNGTKEFSISGFQIIYTNRIFSVLLFISILFFLLLNITVMVYVYLKKYDVNILHRIEWIGIPLIIIIASIPIMTDYQIIGADFIFHIQRIESLYESLKNGIFPVRIEGRWLYGHGYANSIFYSDLFLLFPAFLRFIGFPLGFSYNLYIFFINCITVLIAYFSFKGIFSSKKIGLFGSILYTLAPYRLYNIYNRSALGEYTAMSFLPLLIYGFYKLFTENVNSNNYKKYWIVLVMGFTGIIQSHVLSCEIVGFFVIILCIILVKNVLCIKIFTELLKTVVGTIILNISFLLPFFDLMFSDEYFFSLNSNSMIQKRGTLFAHFFYTMQSAGSSSHFHLNGLVNTEPIGVGIAILISVLFFVFLKKDIKKHNYLTYTAGKISFCIGMLALIMSSCYFPWDRLKNIHPILGKFASMIQFPTRLTFVTTICFVFVGCVVLDYIKRLKFSRNVFAQYFVVFVCGFSIIFSLFQISDILNTKRGGCRIYSPSAIGHSAILGAEYLPLNAGFNYCYHEPFVSEGVEIYEFWKKELDSYTVLSVQDGLVESYIDLPMIYYKGYLACDIQSNSSFDVISSEDGHVRVLLPPSYYGTVRTYYSGMWYWHYAELVSLITLLIIILKYVKNYLKRMKC